MKAQTITSILALATLGVSVPSMQIRADEQYGVVTLYEEKNYQGASRRYEVWMNSLQEPFAVLNFDVMNNRFSSMRMEVIKPFNCQLWSGISRSGRATWTLRGNYPDFGNSDVNMDNDAESMECWGVDEPDTA